MAPSSVHRVTDDALVFSRGGVIKLLTKTKIGIIESFIFTVYLIQKSSLIIVKHWPILLAELSVCNRSRASKLRLTHCLKSEVSVSREVIVCMQQEMCLNSNQ